MTVEKQTVISKDLDNKKLLVVREFNAPPELVWQAWTQSELLDLWWAPKPWRAETKSMDFKEGGLWLYSMVGPDGTRAWCRVDFQSVVPNKSFVADDNFCDEEGKTDKSFPNMHWSTRFSSIETGTKVEIEISFRSVADMEKIIEMGFKEGFTAALVNLDELLSEQLQ